MSTEHPFRGILYICSAVFLFASSDALSKYLTTVYPVVMVLWARYVVHVLLMVGAFAPSYKLGLVKTQRPWLQLLRGVCMVCTNLFFISALRFIPLAEGTSIIYITPLLVTAFSGPVLGEKVTRFQWMAVLIGFIGVLIVVRPGGALFTPVALLALAAALSFTCYHLVTRILNKTDSSITSNFISGVVSALVTSVALPYFWKVPTLHMGLLMAGLGFMALTSHMLMTHAYHHAKPSVLAPFTYTQLIFAGIIGYLLFGHVPDHWAMLGILIISVSGLMVMMGQRQSAKG